MVREAGAGTKGPLNFWLGVEAFSPQNLPKRSESRSDVPYVRDYVAGMSLPWSPDVLWATARRGYVWRHTVYLGIFDLKSAWDVLGAPDTEDFAGRASGRSAVAVLTVDQDGTLIQGSEVLSQCVWAAGQVRRRGRLEDVFEDFAADEAQWRESLGDLVVARGIRVGGDSPHGFATHPVTFEDLKTTLGMSLKTTGTTGLLTLKGAPVGTMRIQSEQISLKRAAETESGFLNSMFSADLYRLSRQSTPPGAAAQYLGRRIPGTKADVRRELETVYESVAPRMVPDGRWPSDPGHPLALSQQFAVNRALADLEDGEGIFSVNGPPGTGKTTMLRDMIAALVTQRATALAAFVDPSKAFVARHQLKSKTKFSRTVHELHPSLRGFEMVIASSNNGAVENISLEIPWKHPDVIAKEFQPAADYFTDIATELLNERTNDARRSQEPRKQAWGLVSAKLGNSKNRAAFVSTALYGDKEPAEGLEAVPGLLQLLEGPPGAGMPTWAEARKSFLAARNEVSRLRTERQNYHERFREAPVRSAEIARLEQTLAADSEVIKAHDTLLTDQARELRTLRDREPTLQAELEAHAAVRPGLLEQFRTSGDVMTQWRERYTRLTEELDQVRTSIDGLVSIHEDTRHTALELSERLRQTGEDLQRRLKLVEERRKAQAGSLPPSPDWFDQASTTREKNSPWLDVEFNRARSELFLQALRLHQAFVLDQRVPMRQNFLAVQDVLKNDVAAEASSKTVKHAWEALFMVVPTVTTTFASVPRLFSSLGNEQLGWMFVDEAGQAAPQHALCGIARVRRSLLVGDPLQLTPVVTLPAKYQARLLEITSTGEQWLPAHNPAQVLADRHTKYGTIIQPPGGDELWVGAPLRVHRRCDDPMFRVVNEEVYGGLMLHGEDVPLRPFPKDTRVQAPGSAWFDVYTGDWNGHASPQELAKLDEILHALRQAGYDMGDILVVSPFRDAAKGVATVARKHGIDADTSSGTVHRAQGKEAGIVVVVLGGKTRGARNWAVETPNLFNVAVSRAKRRLYVIGSHRDWTQLQYFKSLAPHLMVHGQEAPAEELFSSLTDPAGDPMVAHDPVPSSEPDPADVSPDTVNDSPEAVPSTLNTDSHPVGQEVNQADARGTAGMPRKGTTWDYSDYRALIKGLQDGFSDEELEICVRRTIGGIRSRAHWLLPPGTVKPGRAALDCLREMVLNPDFDWEVNARENHAAELLPFWDPETDEMLLTAWTTGSPGLPALAQLLLTDEDAVARRLLTLGYAESRLAIVDRLGCTPGSPLESNARLARDKASVLIWVLTAVDQGGTLRHLSLHQGREAASETGEALQSGPDDQATWLWAVSEAIVGEAVARSTVSLPSAVDETRPKLS